MAPLVQQTDWSISTLVPPTSEPITLTRAKTHLKIDPLLTEEDDDIQDYIAAARSYLEETFFVRIMPQKVEMQISQFPREDRIRLVAWPIRSIDYVRYTDINGNVGEMNVGTSTTAGATVLTRLNRKPCELKLPFAKIWPTAVLQESDGVQIGMSVGYLRGDSPETLPIPPAVIGAMKLLITNFYENRSAVTNGTLDKTDPLAISVGHLMANVRLY